MAHRKNSENPARILVVGLGGAGCNLVRRLAQEPPKGVELVLANTDTQALLSGSSDKEAPEVVFLGEGSTQGLGAGGDQELGRLAAEQSKERLSKLFHGVDMVFLTTGLGGGTGTGAAPVVARLAREAGALIVAVVTTPFEFEGRRRVRTAEEGLQSLEHEVDSLLVLPNQRLLTMEASALSLGNSFEVVDQVLCDAVTGMAEIVTQPGVINLDYADIKAMLQRSGKALFGMATAESATKAVELALNNPLIGANIKGSSGCLINIVAGPDISLNDFSDASKILQESAAPDAMILCGFVQLEEMYGQARATVVATRVETDCGEFTSFDSSPSSYEQDLDLFSTMDSSFSKHQSSRRTSEPRRSKKEAPKSRRPLPKHQKSIPYTEDSLEELFTPRSQQRLATPASTRKQHLDPLLESEQPSYEAQRAKRQRNRYQGSTPLPSSSPRAQRSEVGATINTEALKDDKWTLPSLWRKARRMTQSQDQQEAQ